MDVHRFCHRRRIEFLGIVVAYVIADQRLDAAAVFEFELCPVKLGISGEPVKSDDRIELRRRDPLDEELRIARQFMERGHLDYLDTLASSLFLCSFENRRILMCKV